MDKKRKSDGKPPFDSKEEEIDALRTLLFSAQKENKRLKKANARLEGRKANPAAARRTIAEMFPKAAPGKQPAARTLEMGGPNAAATAKQTKRSLMDTSPSTSVAAALQRAFEATKPVAKKPAAIPAVVKKAAKPAAKKVAANPAARKPAAQKAEGRPADGSEVPMDQGPAAEEAALEEEVSPQETGSWRAAQKRRAGDGRIPAITAYNVQVKVLRQRLGEVGVGDFFCKILNKNVTNVYCRSLVDYQKTKDLMERDSIRFYSYTPRALRPYNVVVKGLSGCYEEEDVRGHLADLKIQLELVKVSHIGADRWLLQLGRQSDLEGLYQVKYFLHCRVYMTKYKKSGVTQCFNCQRFGHVAINCKMQFRCVKCASTHTPGACPILSREEEAENPEEVGPARPPVKCVNCNAFGHTAGSLQCPKRLAILKRRSEAKQKKPEAKAAAICRRVTSDVTFAQMARGNSTGATPQPEKKPNSLDGEFKRIFKKDLLTCLKKVANFPEVYATLENDKDRATAFMTLLIQLSS